MSCSVRRTKTGHELLTFDAGYGYMKINDTTLSSVV